MTDEQYRAVLYGIECRLAAKAAVVELNNDEQCILFDCRAALNDVDVDMPRVTEILTISGERWDEISRKARGK